MDPLLLFLIVVLVLSPFYIWIAYKDRKERQKEIEYEVWEKAHGVYGVRRRER